MAERKILACYKDMKILERWRRTAVHNQALVIAGGFAAFGTLFYAGAAVFQVCIMKQSAYQASMQTEKLITQATKNADAAAAFSTSADKINKQVKLATDEFRKIANTSEKNLRTISDNARLDLRAWLNTGQMKTVNYGGGECRFTMPVFNAGKTPALQLEGKFAIAFKWKNLPYMLGGEKHPVESYLTAIGRDSGIEITLGCDPKQPIAEITQRAIAANFSVLYVHGTLSYKDVFNYRGSVPFCQVMNAQNLSFTECGTPSDTECKEEPKPRTLVP